MQTARELQVQLCINASQKHIKQGNALLAKWLQQSAEYHAKFAKNTAEQTRKTLDKMDNLRNIYPDSRSEHQLGGFRNEWYKMLDDCLCNLYD